jgi:pre-mRNA-splicing factor SYF1
MSIQLSDKELAFEEELHRQPYSLKIWWEYLSTSSGITAPPKKRNQLFERALAKLPGSYKLWHAYLNLRRKDVVGMWVGGKGYTRVNNLFERSLVFMHKVRSCTREFSGSAAQPSRTLIAMAHLVCSPFFCSPNP